MEKLTLAARMGSAYSRNIEHPMLPERLGRVLKAAREAVEATAKVLKEACDNDGMQAFVTLASGDLKCDMDLKDVLALTKAGGPGTALRSATSSWSRPSQVTTAFGTSLVSRRSRTLALRV